MRIIFNPGVKPPPLPRGVSYGFRRGRLYARRRPRPPTIWQQKGRSWQKSFVAVARSWNDDREPLNRQFRRQWRLNKPPSDRSAYITYLRYNLRSVAIAGDYRFVSCLPFTWPDAHVTHVLPVVIGGFVYWRITVFARRPAWATNPTPKIAYWFVNRPPREPWRHAWFYWWPWTEVTTAPVFPPVLYQATIRALRIPPAGLWLGVAVRWEGDPPTHPGIQTGAWGNSYHWLATRTENPRQDHFRDVGANPVAFPI